MEQWSPLFPGHFNKQSLERKYQYIVNRRVARPELDALEKREVSFPCQESRCDSSDIQQTYITLSLYCDIPTPLLHV